MKLFSTRRVVFLVLLLALLGTCSVLYMRYRLTELLATQGISKIEYKINYSSISAGTIPELKLQYNDYSIAAQDILIDYSFFNLLSGFIDGLSVGTLHVTNINSATIERVDKQSPLQTILTTASTKIPSISIGTVDIAKLCSSFLNDCLQLTLVNGPKLNLTANYLDYEIATAIEQGSALSVSGELRKATKNLVVGQLRMSGNNSKGNINASLNLHAENLFAIANLHLPISLESSLASVTTEIAVDVSPERAQVLLNTQDPIDLAVKLKNSSIDITKLKFKLGTIGLDVSNSKAQFSLADTSIMNTAASPKQRLILSAGQIAAEGTWPFVENEIDQTKVKIAGMTGAWDKYFVKKAQLELMGSLRNSSSWITTKPASIEEFNPFLPFENLSFDLAALKFEPAFKIDLRSLTASVVNGEVSSKQVVFDSLKKSHNFDISLSRLDLEKLLELYPQESLIGLGKFSGKLEFKLEDKILTLANSKLYSENPGGELRYTGEMGSGQSAQLDLVHKALKHYVYNSCEIQPELNPKGDLTLAVSLKGSSPALNTSRPVNVNLNVTENIPALLESFRIVRELPAAIERGIQ